MQGSSHSTLAEKLVAEGGRVFPVCFNTDVCHAGLWTQSSTACWSPGMQGSSPSALAESLVLRGPRRGGVALQSQQAADLLDQSLMLEGRLTGDQQI